MERYFSQRATIGEIARKIADKTRRSYRLIMDYLLDKLKASLIFSLLLKQSNLVKVKKKTSARARKKSSERKLAELARDA